MLAASVSVVVAFIPASALAGTGGSVPANVQADIAKTQTDVQALHNTVVADANKIQSDIKSLQGTTDCKQAAATLKADWQKLISDRIAGNATIKADWKQLRSDWQAARSSKQGRGQIKPLVQAMVSANLQLRADLRQAVKAAHQAARALRQSLKGQCHNKKGQGTTTS